MGLMDRLYRFGSKPYIMDYNGAVNFLGRCVVPIQIGDIIGSVLNGDKTPPTVFYFPVRITKPLNYKFTNVNIKLVTLSNAAFSSSRIRVSEAKLYTDKNVEVASTQTTHRWLDTGVRYPTGDQYTYFEGINVQIPASNIAGYNNYYILKVTVNNNIFIVSQTKIFLEYDNYISFLNTMENQRFGENQLNDFKFNDILANDMYQVGYFDSIYAKWEDKKKKFWAAGSNKESISYKGISGTFFSTDEIIFKVPSVVTGHHWRLYAGGEQLTPSLQEIGRTGTGEWFLKLTTNWWSGTTSPVAGTPITCFAMDGQPKQFVRYENNIYSIVVASVMNYPNYTFKRYNGETLIETIDEDIHPFYFNIFNKKTRVISAGDYADNLTLNRAIESKWNVEKFTEMIDEGEEFNGWMKNYPMVKPPVVYTPTYNGVEALALLDFNMACLTELINNIPIRSYKDASCNVQNGSIAAGKTGTPFGKESTTLWQIPFGVRTPNYSIAGGQPSGFGG